MRGGGTTSLASSGFELVSIVSKVSTTTDLTLYTICAVRRGKTLSFLMFKLGKVSAKYLGKKVNRGGCKKTLLQISVKLP